MFKGSVFIFAIAMIGLVLLSGVAYTEIAWWAGILVAVAYIFAFVKWVVPSLKL